MEINITAENRQLTVALTGELDHHTARKLMDSLDQLIELHLPSKTILDSSGIAVVLRAKRRMEALQGALLVVNIPRQAARVLETAGMSRYVDLV